MRLVLLLALTFVVAALLTFGCNWLCARRWRRARVAHWTEQARLLWPVRNTAALNIWFLSIESAALVGLAAKLPLPEFVPLGMAGWVGSILATFPLDHEMFPRLRFGRWLRVVVSTWTLRAGVWGVLLAGGILMPDEFNIMMIIIASGEAAFIVAWSWKLYWWGLKLLGLLSEKGERLHSIVEATARKMSVVNPATWEMNTPFAQAYALPQMGTLMFSRRLIEILDDEEVSAVCAHEIAHLTEPRRVLVQRMLGALAFYPLLFLRPALHYGPSAVCALCGYPFCGPPFAANYRAGWRCGPTKLRANSKQNPGRRFMREPWKNFIRTI
jgi:Zn-dependent protease with chaperone function